MPHFTFTQADGSPRALAGYRYAPPKAAAKRYATQAAAVSRLPAKVDLRRFMTAVEQQGETNSCAANATAGAYEYLVKRHLGEEAYDVSRLFIYYNARALETPDDVRDEGSVLQAVIDGLKRHGACSEETWPFEPAAVNAPPSDDAYAEARQFLIEDTELVPTELEAWKTALAEGHPIIFGLKLFGSFDKHKRAGLVPLPTPTEAARESHGGHAMLCVGYSDPDQVFIVRNSWGPEWGDRGYCYIPYRYAMSPEYNFGDSWIIKHLDVLPPDEATWSDDGGRVLEDVSSVLASLDDETFAAVIDSMGDVPIEVRLALLFLVGAGADGDISEEELTAVAEHLTPLLELLGSAQRPERVLENALRLAQDAALVDETIELFGQTFPPEVLASIVGQLEDVAAADELTEEEAAFVDTVIERWQVQPAE